MRDLINLNAIYSLFPSRPVPLPGGEGAQEKGEEHDATEEEINLIGGRIFLSLSHLWWVSKSPENSNNILLGRGMQTSRQIGRPAYLSCFGAIE